jgi:phenylpropionate dioxygenase-like ring-hydroxylating dioxygenase large terminal subunit
MGRFLKNHWYVAAWSDELGKKDLLPVTMLNEAIVLYRMKDGTPVALENRCIHRRVPLSEGKRIGDDLRCGYHGLVYDCTGRCVNIPGQVDVPAGAGVKAYPVVERHTFIYVWMGDPAAADETKIVDFPYLSDPDWGATKQHLHLNANYLLLIDNLSDASHVAYLHSSTVGNAAVAEDADVVYERVGDVVRVTREMLDVPAAKTYVDFGAHGGNFDRWSQLEWRAPAFFVNQNGSEATGLRKPGLSRCFDRGEWGFQVYHAITPETDRTTNQFSAIAHELSAVPKKDRKEFYRQCHQVFIEDFDMYNAQQLMIDSDPEGATPENIGSRVTADFDQGFLQARRIIDRKLKEEEAARRRKKPAAKKRPGGRGKTARTRGAKGKAEAWAAA